ncbi:hypothetical protein B0H17DRAFT_1087324 [Mycena rosella]|uniref:G domain-containing protein n=1 Tax=Mycena rosella TaxID=1033263 RepID=A0AAD7G576_MYCRO|nr:hypothetical protein B0H17DRAFT_1087324 [Mycena rosella]
MSTESTIEDILETCKRFRIVSVGGSGAGKSSLIDHVFQVNDAKVSHFNPGDAEIDKEITSEINPRFVLHDSKGFEPSKLDTFDVVSDFLQRKSATSLELKERLHAVWLCIHTPTDGARVLEAGDEKFLKRADELQIPVVVVFTQYDRLVRKYTGENRLKLAQKDFDGYVESLSSAATRLKIPMPRYINVSVRKNYTDNISELVKMTRETVEERLKGDAWIMWAVAQRASVPLKIDACVAKGMSYYWRTMSGSLPGVGDMLLRQCLVQVHKDIVACWNLRDGETVLNGDEFKHLMLYVVQDMHEKSHPKSPPDIEKISQFVTLCTAVTAAIAPPVAILGLTYFFVSWISNAILSNTPDVQRVLITYTVDLILVLEELFKIALQPRLLGKISWKELEEAFEAYQRSTSQRSVHSDIRALVERQGGPKLDLPSIRKRMEELIYQYRQTM